jgi:catechol 2,3-dioxygenase-like lactoylglutathione lyase family enzyme
MEHQVTTVTVSNLTRSRHFYETILGFKFNGEYSPTKWVQYKFETDSFFAIQEKDNFTRSSSYDEIDFYTKDVEALWHKIKDSDSIVIHQNLQMTEWGSYKFVLIDPDGLLLGFVQKPKCDKFDMIGIFVKDIKRMVDFYKNVLGMSIDWNGEGGYAEFNHKGIRFSMFRRDELPQILGTTPEYPKKLNGTFELAINLGKPENVDIKFHEIIKNGGQEIYKPRNEPWKMRSAMIADPEGNIIEIASDFWS